MYDIRFRQPYSRGDRLEIEIQTLPESPKQVFALATPQHLLGKLHWEINQLETMLASPDVPVFRHLEAAYFAFNAAVTAWHITDWVWQSLSEAEQAAICSEFDPKKIGLNEFKHGMGRLSRDLKICQQIANGSKHYRLDRPDKDLTVKLRWRRRKARSGELSAGSPIATYKFEFVVLDNEIEKDAVSVFRAVEKFWQDWLGKWGFAEATLVMAQGPDI